jgi:hypothetical protein
MNQDVSSSPAGQGKRGMYCPSFSTKETSHISAMRSVLSHASGSSRKRWRISAAT